MDYKIYTDKGKGYEYINTYDLVDTIFFLDTVILEQNTKK